MKNLAGVVACDEYIRRELERARIPAVDVERVRHPDVSYSVIGKLGPFEFRRAWYYWTVDGPVPLDVARELYEDPVGKEDVRVAGHCGCPPPEHPWVTYFDAEGFQLVTDPERKLEKERDALKAKGMLSLDSLRFVDDAASVAVRAIVGTYHIDTEVGLRLFVDTIRRACLPDEPRTLPALSQ